MEKATSCKYYHCLVCQIKLDPKNSSNYSYLQKSILQTSLDCYVKCLKDFISTDTTAQPLYSWAQFAESSQGTWICKYVNRQQNRKGSINPILFRCQAIHMDCQSCFLNTVTTPISVIHQLLYVILWVGQKIRRRNGT